MIESKLEPVAWAVFSDNGNMRCWAGNSEHATLQALRDQGLTVHPLYAKPEIAAAIMEFVDSKCAASTSLVSDTKKGYN